MSAVDQEITLEASWLAYLAGEFTKPYMQDLKDFLFLEKAAGKAIYPARSEYFSAFSLTPVGKVKVVILGQDPYHGPGQAHGLCFSVRQGVKTPPSLVNIYKEIHAEFGSPIPSHGDLSSWADQGVLLLNSVLTVERANAASHQKRGWEQFTDRVIEVVNDECDGVVFMLWGAYAQKKGAIIDRERHLVLSAPHPSPLSAHRGFLGCGHFTLANDYLESHGRSAIDWSVPEEFSLLG
ncbi:MAG: uracil-DNA glycosylase [Pseudomonadales bacterium]